MIADRAPPLRPNPWPLRESGLPEEKNGHADKLYEICSDSLGTKLRGSALAKNPSHQEEGHESWANQVYHSSTRQG
ncbi:hypothetical protein IF2G_05054 [Cordyceps javanica]|nr:hypothetical protein IF2G_05054 [Cordyceps javanica]